ncbi:hypothetical protein VPH35_010937 [Triticum aestivum]
MAARAKPPAATTLHDVPDKLLELILECLMESPLCLVRAAAACKRWRRIMAASRFFEWAVDTGRYPQGPHPRPLAGNYYNRASPRGREVVFVPAAAQQQPAVDGRHFSLDFLPGGRGAWEVVDSSRSLLLLARRRKSGRWMRRCFPDLLLCEPATRRYRLIPRMEEMKHHPCLGAYLIGTKRTTVANPASDETHVVDSMETFKVACVVYQAYDGVCDDIGCATVYFFARNSKTEARRGIPGPHSWYAEQSSRLCGNIPLDGAGSLHFLGHTCSSDCLFWSFKGDDGQRLVTYGGRYRWLPDSFQQKVLQVTEDRTHENIRFVCLQGSNLRILVLLARRSFKEWKIHNSVELKEATRGLGGYKEEYFDAPLKVVVTSPKSIIFASAGKTWLFSVDLDTMAVTKRNHKTADHLGMRDFPCEQPWPPTLRACTARCSRRGQGPCSHTCTCMK